MDGNHAHQIPGILGARLIVRNAQIHEHKSLSRAKSHFNSRKQSMAPIPHS